MVYVCKVYANGKLQETKMFQTLLEAENWACDNSGLVSDIRFTVSIYGDVKEDADLTHMYPLKILLQ